MQEKTLNDLQCFWAYIGHLCEVFNKLENFDSTNDFINQQNQITTNDFFLDNLFLFDKTTLDITHQYHDKISKKYDSVTESLYHYTSFESLEKIIAGNSLKLNNLGNMNDSMEGGALLEYLKNRPLKSQILKEWLQQSLEYIPQYIPRIFSFSFSTLKDDAAQWERYSTSKNTKTSTSYGVCIEFSKKKLLDQIALQNTLSLREIAPVLYIPNYEKDNVFLEIIFTLTLRALKMDIPNLDISKLEVKQKLAEYLSFYSADVKHDSFKNERELRLIISLSNMPERITYSSLFLNLAQNDSTGISNLITSITTGPRAGSYKPRIKELLKRNNANHIKIYESNCPLR